MTLTVDDKTAAINLANMEVTCPDDETLQQIVQTAVTKLHSSLIPNR